MSGTLKLRYLFDRPRKDHVWKKTFFLNRKSLKYDGTAILQNFEMDPKVCKDREELMFENDDSLKHDTNFDNWETSQLAYFKANLCGQNSDTYAHCNHHNRIEDNLLNHKMLVHVDSIDKLILRPIPVNE